MYDKMFIQTSGAPPVFTSEGGTSGRARRNLIMVSIQYSDQ
jgi:hypothetical protein